MTMIDLSLLDPPDLVEMLDFEAAYQMKLAYFKRIYPDWSAALESDPVVKLIELAAYEEVRFRARVIDAARATMLAYATGADLEHIAVLWGVEKAIVDPGDPNATPPRPPRYERDERFRLRTQLAIETSTDAGPIDAYRKLALDASPDVLDVWVDRPEPGTVRVTIMSQSNGGVPDDALLDAVRKALSPEDVRPLNDTVLVVPARPITYAVEADVYVGRGPDPAVVLAERRRDLDVAVDAARRLKLGMARSAIAGALHPRGSSVVRVDLKAPLGDVTCNGQEFAACTSVVLNLKVLDE
ncbi:baseplate J protein [Burkholderia sp. ABCPW 14]|uniref:baseplate assembly protein n=1 Tax=Burkholderia sp. ABCPW 14 TaxID=1637860 RepID=UPI000770C44C|nr:baseplate J/gp47 family protein [Burkholderia sp. ABCPW 14]KVD76984.1 baseplate J protein [Burkholderia sp. ABCPW 14]